MVICFLGIGSNLGNRRENIELAIRRINQSQGVKVIKVSKIIETLPVGGPKHQGKFLNSALKVQTSLSAAKLLRKLKTIERQLGRKKSVRFGPRIIDLDILFYGDKVINRKDLIVPHPKVFKRKFAIRPLLGIL